jgi:hypothetical protein
LMQAEFLASEAMRVSTSLLRWQPFSGPTSTSSPRLYLRSSEGAYSEDAAYDATRDASEASGTASFRIAVPSLPLFVRFDPTDCPGIFVLRALAVNGATVHNLAACVRDCSERLITAGAADGIRFASSGNDPWIELRLDERHLPSERGTLVTVTVDWVTEKVFDALELAVDRAVRHSIDPGIDRLRRDLVERDQREETNSLESRSRLDAALTELREKLDDVAERSQRGSAMVHELQRESRDVAEASNSALVRVEARLAELDSALRDALVQTEGRLSEHAAAQTRHLGGLIEAQERARAERTVWARASSLLRGRRVPPPGGVES